MSGAGRGESKEKQRQGESEREMDGRRSDRVSEGEKRSFDLFLRDMSRILILLLI